MAGAAGNWKNGQYRGPNVEGVARAMAGARRENGKVIHGEVFAASGSGRGGVITPSQAARNADSRLYAQRQHKAMDARRIDEMRHWGRQLDRISQADKIASARAFGRAA